MTRKLIKIEPNDKNIFDIMNDFNALLISGLTSYKKPTTL